MKKLILLLIAFLFLNRVNAQSIQLLTPNGGEILTGCTDATISWTKQGNPSTYVNLYYSVDEGLNWRSIQSNYYSPNASGNVIWSVPTVNSNKVKIKIQDTYNATVKDSSDLPFTISSDLSTTGLTVISPNGGESVTPATVQAISWTSKGTIGNVNIVYSVDGGKTWNPVSGPTIIAINIANTGTFNWLIPADVNLVSSSVLIRVYETNKPCNTDFSDAFFTINNNSNISIQSPVNNETWYVGREHNLSWRSFNIPGDKVKVDYSVDNGSNWIVLDDSISSNAGFSLPWIVPNTVTNQGLMRVSASRNTTIQSVVNFKIAKPYLLLNRPNGGEVLSGCNNAYISWTQLGIANTIYVDYSLDGGNNWNVNAISTYSNKNGPDSVAFSIPNVNTTTARFRIHENTNQLVSLRDSSDANVTIAADASRAITLVYPNGGESVAINSVQKVTWTSKGAVGNVNIQYSNDDGATWKWMYAFTGESSENIPNTGVFHWEVYSFLSPADKIKIRIYESANPCIIDWTDNVFGLNNDPHISIVKPVDGDSLFVGGPYAIPIQWLSTDVVTVDIDYSLDNGVTWNILFNSIYSSNGGNNARPWTIPTTLTDTGILRIRSTTTPSIENKITFKIVNPILRLIAPTGGESFTSCTNTNISWFQKATSSNITIQYSLDEGVNWLGIDTMTNGKNGLNNYSWSVPNINTSKLRVRVSDPRNAKVIDASKTNATIVADTSVAFTITSPNGGELLVPTTTHKVTWTTKSFVQLVSLEYSTDAGKTWKFMSDAQGNSSSYVYNTGSFDWLVTNDAAFSNKCLVRISQFSKSCIVDYSNSFFTIDNTPRITVLQPKANDTLYKGVSCYFIKWSHYNIPADKVSMDYSLDNGANWNVIIDSTPSVPIGNIFQWTIPKTLTNQGKFRISATRDKSIKYEVNFKIDTLFVTLLYPVGGEVFTNCAASKIIWQSHGKPEALNFDYSLDEGKSWSRFLVYLGTVGKDSSSWIPPNVSCTTARIRIVGECNKSIGDSTKTNFTINKSPLLGLRLISPNGGESYSVNTLHEVKWETKGKIDYITILYSTDDGLTWGSMTNSQKGESFNIPNTGSFIWQVPGGLYASSKVKVQIYDHNNRCLADFADSLFSIDRNPSVAIVKPKLSDTLYPGKTYDLQWTTYAFPTNAHGYVHIEYSLDSGSTWISVEDSTYSLPDPQINSFKWTVPNTLTDQAILRIHSARNKAYKDEVHFKIIAPYVKLLNPIGNEKWYQGEPRTIAWNVGGLDNNSLLNIEYSTNNAQTWHLIKSVNSGQSNYTWTVPDTIPVSSNCYIKISSTDFPLCKDSNKLAFSIQEPFQITSPHAGEIWHIGESKSIQWNSTRSSGSVMIEYSLNNGGTWNEVIATTPNTGSYLWKLPAALTPSIHCLIKVKGVVISTVYNISDIFEIAGPVVTAVQSLETDGSWTVYPNPTQSILQLSSNAVSSGNVHIRLINAEGQLVFDQNDHAISGMYTKVINLNKEKPGIYILQIITDKQVITRRVTKN
jgi:hypothetical protein